MGFADLNGAPVEGGHGTEGCETARDALNSDTFLVNRRRFILHPRGVKFTSASVAGANPTTRNWKRPQIGCAFGKTKTSRSWRSLTTSKPMACRFAPARRFLRKKIYGQTSTSQF
jgi:hypothetical protein